MTSHQMTSLPEVVMIFSVRRACVETGGVLDDVISDADVLKGKISGGASNEMWFAISLGGIGLNCGTVVDRTGTMLLASVTIVVGVADGAALTDVASAV